MKGLVAQKECLSSQVDVVGVVFARCGQQSCCLVGLLSSHHFSASTGDAWASTFLFSLLSAVSFFPVKIFHRYHVRQVLANLPWDDGIDDGMDAGDDAV